MSDPDLLDACVQAAPNGQWKIARVGRTRVQECYEVVTNVTVYRWPDRQHGPGWGASSNASCAVGDTPEEALSALVGVMKRTIEHETACIGLLEGCTG